jgi:hypothetical protein
VNDQNHRSARVRYTATGALATLAVVGAIAGASALAAKPHAKTPGAPVPGKTHASQPGSSQPFLNAVQQLVNAGTITAAEGQALNSQIQTGRVDTDTLASIGFTAAQLQAVQQALASTKQALAGGPTPTQTAKLRRS